MSDISFGANRREPQLGSPVLSKTVLDYLRLIQDPRGESLLRFHSDHERLINASKGSGTKHQAWPGGYVDHVAEIFRIAEVTYSALCSIRQLPFRLDSALIVLYFHDIEKIWKYTEGLPRDFDKDAWYDSILPRRYGINFTPDETNALQYIHGESEAEYDPRVRKAGPLAAFCHSADIISARTWYDEGRGLGARL